jgi:hypothetical protein
MIIAPKGNHQLVRGRRGSHQLVRGRGSQRLGERLGEYI